MDLSQIKGHHLIDGTNRMPNINEHLKLLYWDNNQESIDYTKLIYIKTITLEEGDNINIIDQDDNLLVINISPNNILLPGNTKVLFDDNDSIGGESNFVYDKVTHKLTLVDSIGIFGEETTLDTTAQSILQYLGKNNLFINFGSIKSVSANNNHITAIGFGALSTVTAGSNDIAIGRKAGANVSATSTGNVFLGPYAGRIEPGDNKLYIGNTDYSSLQDFVEKSLIYGDFALGELYINDQLFIREQIKIGTFDITNTPQGGMIQFVDDTTLVKPQYYDNFVWRDFANSTDRYLSNIDIDSTDPHNILLTFTITGLGDITVTVPDTFLTVAGDIYDLQYNDGSNDLGANSAFNANPLTKILSINGSVALSIQSLSNFNVVGAIVNTGTHIYAKLTEGFVQLDNERTDGETNHGENIGNTVPVFAGMNIDTHNLTFYTLQESGAISITSADGNGNILFGLNYDVSGTNEGTTGVGIYKSVTNTDTASILAFKKLYSSNASVIITAYADYIDLQSTGLGGGEVNNGQNVGLGEGRIWDETNEKNGVNILFRTLKEGSNIEIITGTVDQIVTLNVPNFVDDADNIGAEGVNVYKDYTEIDNKRLLHFRNIYGNNNIYANIVDNYIEIGLTPDIIIPSLSGIITPVSTNLDKTITWSLDYDNNIRDITPSYLENIVQLNFGSNLIYNPTTNTLDSIGGSGDPLDYVRNFGINRNIDGTVNRGISSRNVKFHKESGNYVIWYNYESTGGVGTDTGLGWLAFENDYPIATDTTKGILSVDISNGLTIVDGVLNVEFPTPTPDRDSVLYYPSRYALHDEDNEGIDSYGNSPTELKNTRRQTARYSIGAAYVNGIYTEPFKVETLSVFGHDEVKGLLLELNKITSDYTTIDIVKPKNTTPTEFVEATHVTVGDGSVDVILPNIGSALNVYGYYNGDKIKVFTIVTRVENNNGVDELVADFKIKGNFQYHCTDDQM